MLGANDSHNLHEIVFDFAFYYLLFFNCLSGPKYCETFRLCVDSNEMYKKITQSFFNLMVSLCVCASSIVIEVYESELKKGFVIEKCTRRTIIHTIEFNCVERAKRYFTVFFPLDAPNVVLGYQLI